MRVGGYTEQSGEKCNPGTMPAVLAAVFDVGLHRTSFDGEEKTQHKVALMWEVDDRDTKGRRFTLFQVVTNSSNEKANLTKIVGALMGRAPTEAECEEGFDMDPLIGTTCLVQVAPPREGKKWPYIENVMPLPRGMNRLVVETDVMGDDPGFVKMMREKAVKPTSPTATNSVPPHGGARTAEKPADERRTFNPDDPPF